MAEPVLVRLSDPMPPASSASISSRREFLQRVAVAALATSVGGTQPAYAVLYPKPRRHRHQHHIPKYFYAHTDDRDAARVFGGELLEVKPDRVTLLADGNIRQVPITSRSTLWRDGNTSIDRLVPGDRLLVRTNARGALERGWSNLVRLRGTVVGSSGSPATYLVEPFTAIGQGSKVHAPSGCIDHRGDPCDPLPGGVGPASPVIVQTDDATAFVDADEARGRHVEVFT
jgi:hypothetical protein